MRVKICGITNIEDAQDAINAGVNALGFVFYKKSARYITPQDALKIVKKLPPFIQCVALFVNESSETINEICKIAHMDLAQIISENESDEYFSSLTTKYIKVLRAKSKEDILNRNDEYILVDAFVAEFGGEGKRVALEWFKDVDCSKIVLAGGLRESNLKELSGYDFYGVDVSSGVELRRGKKDKIKMINFVKAANEI
ncbi:N-(5'-phosphoribosyl)anthranilate isomerase [Arcobacter sp. 31_11_sub10_T18]|nr:N-(5'-phosphoribosyl)anthranilate isomerase [Arcobacter sp. 31_11_sub10_T18]